jgi:cephalosporin hydroxylase
MSLVDLVDNTRTDKNTVHSYLEVYDILLKSKKESALNVLEVGIYYNGGSIKLWNDYFSNATVHALDIIPLDSIWDGIKNNPKIILYTSCNAYTENVVQTNFVNKNLKFDFMIDDGPHTLESMTSFINLYFPLLADDGIMIIEDITEYHWINTLTNAVPETSKKYIEVYDRRQIKGRYDDILFVINKSKQI